MKFRSALPYLLGLLPFAALVFSVSWWDRATPVVCGLPFNFFWVLVWIPATTAAMAIAHRLQKRR